MFFITLLASNPPTISFRALNSSGISRGCPDTSRYTFGSLSKLCFVHRTEVICLEIVGSLSPGLYISMSVINTTVVQSPVQFRGRFLLNLSPLHTHHMSASDTSCCRTGSIFIHPTVRSVTFTSLVFTLVFTTTPLFICLLLLRSSCFPHSMFGYRFLSDFQLLYLQILLLCSSI